jgi:hypothetical protein
LTNKSATVSSNPFRVTGIKRQKQPLATNATENYDDFDIQEFDEEMVDTKPTQVIEDFKETQDMQVDQNISQDFEKENL